MYSICIILIFSTPLIAAEFLDQDDWDWLGFGPLSSNWTTEDDPDAKGTGTPSPTCQTIVEDVGWAISNYTLCSVRNARPIHLCEKCVSQYLKVRSTHDKFEATIDEEGNICRDYFVNLDRLQIVSEAYKYVHHLWKKGNCNSCFKHAENGTMLREPTNETLAFEFQYKKTKSCFKKHAGEAANLTCVDCLEQYQNLTDTYIGIQDSCGDSVCMDIVDTMNITRFIWSDRGCVKREGVPLSMTIGIGLLTLLPITFYLLAYFLANKQESPILQQKRLAEIFAVNSNSGNYVVAGGESVGQSPSSTSATIRNR